MVPYNWNQSGKGQAVFIHIHKRVFEHNLRTKSHRMMMLVSKTISLRSRIQMAPFVYVFPLYLTMLKLLSLKRILLVTVLLTNGRNVLKLSHVLA